METILINPPQNTNYLQPQPGLASITAVFEQNCHHVRIMDANALQLSECEIANKVKGADVISITVMTPEVPEETLNKIPEIDMIVREEGRKP